MTSRHDANLADCDSEPIHVPGTIQPHGALAAVDEEERIVVRSANLAAFLPKGADARCLAELMAPDDLAALRAVFAAEAPPSSVPSVQLSGTAELDVIVHRNAQGLRLLEFERSPHDFAELAAVHRQTRAAIGTLGAARRLEELFEGLVDAVRRISGFERVMLYRFFEDASGAVLAESLAPGIGGYRGHRFPASDIPAQARRLYELNLLRLIADVGAEQVPLLASAKESGPSTLDLGFAVLRSVSPVHVRYLENMGVQASMSISILCSGALWGLIACHHQTPRVVPFEVRQACELLGQVAALRIDLQEEQEERLAVHEVSERAERIVQRIVEHRGVAAGLRSELPALHGLFEADALLVQLGADAPDIAGELPPAIEPSALAASLQARATAPLVAVDRLGAEGGAQGRAAWPAGALILRIGAQPQLLLAWLRREIVETVTWAGDPSKAVVRGPDGVDRLQPRESFAAWQEERRGRSAPWTRAERAGARHLQQLLLQTTLRLAEERQAEELERLNAELRAANTDLARFVQIAAHDLQAPARALQRLSEWILLDERDRVSLDSRQNLELLSARAARLERMLRDLVEYSRAGRLQYEWEDFDLLELWHGVIEQIDAAPDFEITQSLAIRKMHAPRVPFEIVLRNLLGNAIRHHDALRGRVELRVELAEEGVRLLVVDDGPGIAPQHRERIFELFRTLQSRDEREGSGMGLALVRRMLEGYGARIHVEDAPGRGAAFCIDWPYPPRGS